MVIYSVSINIAQPHASPRLGDHMWKNTVRLQEGRKFTGSGPRCQIRAGSQRDTWMQAHSTEHTNMNVVKLTSFLIATPTTPPRSTQHSVTHRGSAAPGGTGSAACFGHICMHICGRMKTLMMMIRAVFFPGICDGCAHTCPKQRDHLLEC